MIRHRKLAFLTTIAVAVAVLMAPTTASLAADQEGPSCCCDPFSYSAMVGSLPILHRDTLYFASCAGEVLAVDYTSSSEATPVGRGKTVLRDEGTLVLSNYSWIEAVGADTHSLRWKFPATASHKDSVVNVSPYPLLVDGLVIVHRQTPRHQIVALDIETGRVTWSFDAEDRFRGFLYEERSTVLIDDGAKIYGLAALDGSIRWTIESRRKGLLGNHDGILFLSEGLRLVARNARTGARRWRLDVKPRETIGRGEDVYVLAEPGKSRWSVHAVRSASGQQRWERQLESGRDAPEIAVGGDTQRVVVVLQHVGRDYRLVGFEAKAGKKLWDVSVPLIRKLTLISRRGRLLVVRGQGELAEIDLRTGQLARTVYDLAARADATK